MPQHLEISWERIAAALPADHANILVQLAVCATTHGATLYLVGGAARSVFDGQAITDLDIAISHISPQIVHDLAHVVGGRVATHRQFSTATIIMPRHTNMPTIDVVPTRQETYAHPGALPEVTPADILTDLARRDISVNAIAIAVVPHGQCPVYDPFDGITDLRRRIARLLHPASCVDDPTRIVRMARIATRLRLRVLRTSLDAVRRACHTQAIPRVSAHRWLQELLKTMHEPDPGHVLARLQQWGVLALIHPALRYTRHMRPWLQRAPHHLRCALLLWQARHADLQDFLKTWHEAPPIYRQIPAVRRVITHFKRHPHMPPSQIAALLRPFDGELCGTIALAAPALAQMRARLQHAQQHTPALAITGTDLLHAGFSAGPHIGTQLAVLRDALLDGHTDADTPATQLAWIRNGAAHCTIA